MIRLLFNRWFFICLTVLTVSLFFVWHPIAGFLTHWMVKSYCEKCFQGSFETQDVSWEGLRLYFDGPCVTCSQKVADQEIVWAAEKLIVDVVKVNWWLRELEIKIHVIAPYISTGITQESIAEITDRFNSGVGLFYVKGKVFAENGVLALNDTKNEKRRLDFDYEGIWSKELHNGNLDLYFDGKNSQQNRCQCSLSNERGKELVCALDFAELNAKDLAHLLTMVNAKNSVVQVMEGSLNGSFSFSYGEHGFVPTGGNTNLRNFSFQSPAYALAGFIPEGHFLLLPENETEGIFTLDQGAYLQYSQNDQPSIELTQMTGKIRLASIGAFDIDSQCRCLHKGREFALMLKGEAQAIATKRSSFEMDLQLAGEDGLSITTRVTGKRLDPIHSLLTIDVTNFSSFEWGLLSTALKSETIDSCVFSRGFLDASIELDLSRRHIQEVRVKSFSIKDLQFSAPQFDMDLYVGKAEGTLAFDWTLQNIIKISHGSICVGGGKIRAGNFNQEEWQFTEIGAQINLDKGSWRNSTFEGVFAGLKGNMHIDWQPDAEKIAFKLTGDTEGLGTWIPDKVDKSAGCLFKDDQLTLTGEIAQTDQGLKFGGILEFVSPSRKGVEAIHLGFDLENMDLLVSGASNEAVQNLGSDVLQHILSERTLDTTYTRSLQKQLAALGLVFKNGWFKAQQLPLEKYLSPLLFKEGALSLKGKGDFDGQYNLNHLLIHYGGKDVILENKDFALEVKEIGSPFEQRVQNLPSAMHCFDWNQEVNFGRLPLFNAAYFEKNSGLLFFNLNAQICLENKKASFSRVETFCNGVHFGGDIELDYSSPEKGVFTVDVHIKHIDGKIVDIRDLFLHFHKPLLLLDIPLEGDISLNYPGALLAFSCKPGGYALKVDAQGSLAKGRLAVDLGELELDDLSLDFNYSHRLGSLELKNIQGRILASRQKEYFLKGQHLLISDLDQNRAKFDFSLTDAEGELVRLAGHTYSCSEGLKMYFNRSLTHVVDIHPQKMEVNFRDQWNLDCFKGELSFDLQKHYKRMLALVDLGCKATSQIMPKNLSSADPPEGLFKLDLSYNKQLAYLSYRVTGQNIKIGDHRFDHCVLNGKKKRRIWMIEQLQLDQLALAADVYPEGNLCHLNFLGFRYGDALLVGLEGTYDLEAFVLNARINLLEIDTSQLAQIPLIKPHVEDFALHGDIRGTGSLHAFWDSACATLKASSSLNMSLKSWGFKGLRFQDTENVSCLFDSDRSFVVQNCKSALVSATDGRVQGLIALDKGEYDFSKKEIALEGLHFNTPAENLGFVAQKLAEGFPQAVSSSTVEVIRHMKWIGNVEGTADLNLLPEKHLFKLSLQEGNYYFAKKNHEVNNFSLQLDNDGFRIITQYRYQQLLFWLMAKSTSSTMERGEIQISNLHPDQQGISRQNQLQMIWSSDPNRGFIIEEMQGNISGLDLNLQHQKRGAFSPQLKEFYGRVAIDAEQAAALLSPEMMVKLAALKLGGNQFKLHGKWTVDCADDLFFQGTIEGQEVLFQDYVFQRVGAQMDYSPEAIVLENLIIEDPAGSALIERVDMQKENEEDWILMIPHALVTNLRPSLLRSIENASFYTSKPLVVKQLEIEDCLGRLGEIDSFTGKGRLSFSCSSKRTLHNPLLAVPVELISRLGLDTAVLNPVRGSIFFNIGNGRVYLTKFKDVYSDGRLSKFYLPNIGSPSYIDFDGNINLTVRMKQYNLLFKLAELFTVTVNGTLQRPLYSLQKQRGL